MDDTQQKALESNFKKSEKSEGGRRGTGTVTGFYCQLLRNHLQLPRKHGDCPHWKGKRGRYDFSMDAWQSQPSSERETRPKRTQLLSNPLPQTSSTPSLAPGRLPWERAAPAFASEMIAADSHPV